MGIRAHITIPGVHLDAPEQWEPFIERLERSARGYGPVLSWDNDTDAVVTLSADAHSEAWGVTEFTSVVVDALRSAGIAVSPASVEVQPADDA